MRSLASALLVWLFTVPGEMPSSRAVSASLRSSTKRSTITARWRRGSRPIAVQRSCRSSSGLPGTGSGSGRSACACSPFHFRRHHDENVLTRILRT